MVHPKFGANHHPLVWHSKGVPFKLYPSSSDIRFADVLLLVKIPEPLNPFYQGLPIERTKSSTEAIFAHSV